MDQVKIFNLIQPILGWIVLLSLITFFVSLFLIPYLVGKLPTHCFLELPAERDRKPPPTISSVFLFVLRNILAVILLLAGFIMLFIPGQGLLTIVLGLLLLSFPGKTRAVSRMVQNRSIQKSLNWIREKRGKKPFAWPDNQRGENGR